MRAPNKFKEGDIVSFKAGNEPEGVSAGEQFTVTGARHNFILIDGDNSASAWNVVAFELITR